MKRLALAFAFTLASLPAAADTLWMHLRVEEHGSKGDRVSVNLPLSFVEAVAAVIPDEHDRRRIRVDRGDVDTRELRQAWRQLRTAPEKTAIEIDGRRDGSMTVWKENNRLMIRAHDSRDSAVVQIPAAVADALLGGHGDEVDLVSAVRALAATGEGELVVVSGDDANVRIWIDRFPEGGKR
jgi:hypothetical protein